VEVGPIWNKLLCQDPCRKARVESEEGRVAHKQKIIERAQSPNVGDSDLQFNRPTLLPGVLPL
jgi:hypothetical protein